MALKLVGEVSLDGSGFESGLKRIEGAVHHTGDAIKNLALSAVGIYGIEEAISKTIETADKLIDISRRLGVGLEALQELGFAARQNGADIDQLTSFIEKLNSTRIDPKNIAAFRRLGIGIPESGDVVDLIMKLSQNVRNRSSQQVIGDLREVGGKGAGALLPFLKEDLAEVREEAQRLGIVMKTEDAVALKFIADEFKILSEVIVAALAPAITDLEMRILHFVNTVKAAGTFWGTLLGNTKGSDWRTALDAFMHPFSVTDKRREAVDNIKQAWSKAGAASETDLEEMNSATDARLAELVRRQKAIEQINTVAGLTPRVQSEKQYSDPLLRIGNFLGSSSNPILSVAQLQLSVLRQIERNTAPANTGSDQSLPPI